VVGSILMNENTARDYRTNKKDTKISCFKIINMGINTVLETESQKNVKLKERSKRSTEKDFIFKGDSWIFYFHIRYPTLPHLTLFRFHCV
jgi:hypothetical protein